MAVIDGDDAACRLATVGFFGIRDGRTDNREVSSAETSDVTAVDGAPVDRRYDAATVAADTPGIKRSRYSTFVDALRAAAFSGKATCNSALDGAFVDTVLSITCANNASDKRGILLLDDARVCDGTRVFAEFRNGAVTDDTADSVPVC